MNHRNIARRNCQPRRRVLAWRCPDVYCTVTDMAAPAMVASPLPWWVPAGIARGSQSIEQPLFINLEVNAAADAEADELMRQLSSNHGTPQSTGMHDKTITCVKPNDAVPNPAARGCTPYLTTYDDLAFVPDKATPPDTKGSARVVGSGFALRPYQRRLVESLIRHPLLRGVLQPQQPMNQAEAEAVMKSEIVRQALTEVMVIGEPIADAKRRLREWAESGLHPTTYSISCEPHDAATCPPKGPSDV